MTAITTTTTDPESYIHSILGQQTPLEILSPTATPSTDDENDPALFNQLLRVDSLWNLGREAEARELLNKNKTLSSSKIQRDDARTKHFQGGLAALLLGKLPEAYDLFFEASKNSTGLYAVFLGERAVNIAFWMACSGKMHEAGKDLPAIDTTPYAGGVQAFCQHMNGKHKQAEETARSAMVAGFQDPWTLHAVAHSLYSQGRLEECVQFLDDQREHIQSCNPSAFMKGHLEFHQALCFIALKDEVKLQSLIQGALWKDLSESEKDDYWNATGLLGVHWKAELNGLSLDRSTVDEALAILQPTASPTKSSVFSLCILRYLPAGTFRNEWKATLCEGDNSILLAIAEAVNTLYPCGTSNNMSSEQCIAAREKLSPSVTSNNLVKLGASPEQREVLEDFLDVIYYNAT